jgi:hypothetical protein
VTGSKRRPKNTSGRHQPIFAYAGAFQVEEEKKIVTHFVLVSLFPNWIGQKQQRIASIEGDLLHLSTASPIQSGGQSVNA